ncbi:TPR-like protein [Coprinellus micaceus]|uniref:TPR-like protein n=1 Tax=Coprinellus micaceus TaxID=71717 RepID=A0A4Y7TQK4_COPMI|nr:TPR-like protein [Coprinellus micaceus]
MQPEPLPTFIPQLSQRFQSLVWSCIDSDLVKTAVFHAERYYSLDKTNHDARHLYATALLRAQQTYSALHLVSGPRDEQCTGCLEIKAKCCTVLGRYRQAREALDTTLFDPTYVSSKSSTSRVAKDFPEDAAIRCRAGNAALKGNQHAHAKDHFEAALKLNPFLWEALEGLCSIGRIPAIDRLLPPRPLPVKRGPAPVEDTTARNAPQVTNPSFFTPDAGGTTGGAGNLFRGWRPEPQPFRIGPVEFPTRESIGGNESSFIPDNSFQMHRTIRSQPANVLQTNIPRPLSSADEAGPVQKRLRSTAGRQIESSKAKSTTKTVDDPLKKARARQALSFANNLSTSNSQPASNTRGTSAVAKPTSQASTNPATTRRSNRLQSGSGAKQLHLNKHPPTTRDRRRPRNKSSEVDELTANEQQAQEEYQQELADYYLYELVRQFASAARRLALYDCRTCLKELERLPVCHQRSTSVLIMVGKVHYELQDYTSAERAFKGAREIEPYRLWDMEVYSTLLWHLQKNVELSYLAQELLNIDPQSAQAWIAIGNLFSLQKDRAQALTCFRRASQLDPSCAYAFTLSGHETIDENLDRSINFFESALRVDARHYNAWYGLGTCYLRASKIRRAEYHFRKAMEIHPNNAVVLGCVAMTLERRKELNTALDFYNRAIEVSPENALVRYRRAKMMVSMRKYEEAIKDLEYLKRTTPEEANVIFQLAKVYRLVGNEVKSAQSLAAARDIAPKSINKMKRLLDTVKDELDDQMDEG